MRLARTQLAATATPHLLTVTSATGDELIALDKLTPPDKPSWRALIIARRRQVPAELRSLEARRLATHAVTAARSVAATAGRVCAYVPFGDEPGSLAMIDALRTAGYEVMLPVVPTAAPGVPSPAQPMAWAPYLGATSLVAGPFGLRQPAGPRLGPAAALATAAVVLVPALAVDQRGVRLGRGAGWYDRTLPLARPGTPLLAVVRDEEVVARLPAQQHDVLMTGVLTPAAGLRTLPTRLD